jgi:aryl-alcohol dehydrogenase-like predicted oxidoreductase
VGTATPARALDLVPIAALQNPFSVLDRSDEATLELCAERGIAYVPFFLISSAFTGGPQKLATDPAIAQVAERHGVTPAQVALAWLLARYERILLIPGTRSIAHVEENLAAGDVVLDDEDLAALETVTPAPVGH